MTGRLMMGFILFVFGVMACGSSKSGHDVGSVPDVGRRHRVQPDKDTLVLKNETLRLTHITQVWKINNLRQDEGMDKYLRVQKSFLFPIQFYGWVSLDNIEHNFGKCLQAVSTEPEFALEDDHNGSVVLVPGEKVHVGPEKLYAIRVEFENQARCKNIDLQFGVLYGTTE